MLDAARVLATLGVIWTHVVEVQLHPPRVAALGRFGTSYYILAAVLFAYRARASGQGLPRAQELRARARRLLVPFLLWSGIYATLYYRYGRSVGMSLSEIMEWWGPLAGTARHLWFLPFAFVVATLTSLVTDGLRRLETPVLATLAGIGVPFVYWFFECHLFFWLDRPWAVASHLHRADRWIEELPLALSAILVFPLIDRLAQRSPNGLANRDVGPISGATWAFVPVLAACLVQFAYYKWAEPLQPISGGETREFAHVIGACLMASVMVARDVKWLQRLGRFGRHTYFTFLGHVIVLDAVNALVQEVPGFGSLWLSVLIIVGLFATGLLLGPIFERVPLLRWLYPR